MRILISAGEASGDLLGAALLRELRSLEPGVEAFGMGGEALAGEGLDGVVEGGALAVVGLVEALGAVPRARRTRDLLAEAARSRRADVAVLVDSAEFHASLAATLRREGVRVVQYVAPQVWAWRPGRVRTLARDLDAVLCLLPFEPPLFEAEGLPAFHVGHPVVDRVAGAPGRAEARAVLGLSPEAFVLAVLPGSRLSEIGRHWAPLAAAAARLAGRIPDLEVVIPLAAGIGPSGLDPRLAGAARVTFAPRSSLPALAAADVAWVTSGTATLEAAGLGIPHAVYYRVHPATAAAARLLVRGVRFVGMPNLLAGREVVPEIVQAADEVDRLVAVATAWHADPDAALRVSGDLRRSFARLGASGASARAAVAVVERLRSPPRGSTDPVPVGRREARAVAGAVLGLTVFRFGLSGRFGLTPDEAYYRVWADALAWGYQAHAPMIAGWQAVSAALLGDGERAVRAPAVLAAGAATIVFHRLVRRYSGVREGLLATAVFALVPLYAAGALLAVPDAPLMLFWVLALAAGGSLLEGDRGVPPPGTRWARPWAAFGLWAGLAMASKYHGVLLWAGLALGLLLSRRARPGGFARGPSLAVALSSAAFAPVVAWNAAHGWTSFTLQLRHGFEAVSGSAAARVGVLVAGQLALLTPVVPLAALGITVRRLARSLAGGSRPLPRGGLLAVSFAAPVLVLFGLAALRAPVEPNWLAPAWPSVLVGLAAAGARRALAWAAGLSAAGAALLYAHAGWSVVPVPVRIDPLSRVHGWEALAEAVRDERGRLPAGGEGAVVVASNYKDASMLALAVPGMRPWTGTVGGVSEAPPGGWVADLPGHGRQSQWDLWGLPPGALDRDWIWVAPVGPASRTPACRALPDALGPRLVEGRWRGETVRRWHVFRCGGGRTRIPPSLGPPGAAGGG